MEGKRLGQLLLFFVEQYTVSHLDIEIEERRIMSLLIGRSGSLAKVLYGLCRCKAVMAVQMRALSSIASAQDQSNVLSSTATQPLSAPFQENASALDALLEDLHGKIARACEGGGAKAMERHRKRNKLPPRERIAALLDPGSPFLEFSQLAGHNLYGDAFFYTSKTSVYLENL